MCNCLEQIVEIKPGQHSSAFYFIIFKTATASLLSPLSSGYDGESIPCVLTSPARSLVSDCGIALEVAFLSLGFSQSLCLSPFVPEFSSSAALSLSLHFLFLLSSSCMSASFPMVFFSDFCPLYLSIFSFLSILVSISSIANLHVSRNWSGVRAH